MKRINQERLDVINAALNSMYGFLKVRVEDHRSSADIGPNWKPHWASSDSSGATNEEINLHLRGICNVMGLSNMYNRLGLKPIFDETADPGIGTPEAYAELVEWMKGQLLDGEYDNIEAWLKEGISVYEKGGKR